MAGRLRSLIESVADVFVDRVISRLEGHLDRSDFRKPMVDLDREVGEGVSGIFEHDDDLDGGLDGDLSDYDIGASLFNYSVVQQGSGGFSNGGDAIVIDASKLSEYQTPVFGCPIHDDSLKIIQIENVPDGAWVHLWVTRSTIDEPLRGSAVVYFSEPMLKSLDAVIEISAGDPPKQFVARDGIVHLTCVPGLDCTGSLVVSASLVRSAGDGLPSELSDTWDTFARSVEVRREEMRNRKPVRIRRRKHSEVVDPGANPESEEESLVRDRAVRHVRDVLASMNQKPTAAPESTEAFIGDPSGGEE